MIDGYRPSFSIRGINREWKGGAVASSCCCYVGSHDDLVDRGGEKRLEQTRRSSSQGGGLSFRSPPQLKRAREWPDRRGEGRVGSKLGSKPKYESTKGKERSKAMRKRDEPGKGSRTRGAQLKGKREERREGEGGGGGERQVVRKEASKSGSQVRLTAGLRVSRRFSSRTLPYWHAPLEFSVQGRRPMTSAAGKIKRRAARLSPDHCRAVAPDLGD